MALSFSDYLDRVPKVELHCHIAGAVRAGTLAELASANGLRLPRPADTLYQWADFYGFLEVLRLGALALKRHADFARVAYECIADMHRHGGARHVEIFFNPHYYTPNGTAYPEIADGLIEGLARAERELGVSSLLIACIDRSVCLPSEALQMLDWMEAHRRPQVVGVGLDGAERAGPPLVWVEAWRRAGRAGYRRTAHVCEDNQTLFEGPPEHVVHCRDALGCDRLDHGYNLLASPDILARAVREKIAFTVACWTSIVPNRPGRQARIKRMHEAGLPIVPGTDDPTMFKTNLGHGWRTLFAANGWHAAEARTMSLAGVEASWLPEERKAALRAEFAATLDALGAQLDPTDRTLDLTVERARAA